MLVVMETASYGVERRCQETCTGILPMQFCAASSHGHEGPIVRRVMMLSLWFTVDKEACMHCGWSGDLGDQAISIFALVSGVSPLLVLPHSALISEVSPYLVLTITSMFPAGHRERKDDDEHWPDFASWPH